MARTESGWGNKGNVEEPELIRAYTTSPAADLLAQERQRMQCAVEPVMGGIVSSHDANEVVWHTFAGGRVNSTIRYALGMPQPGWIITPGNLSIRARDHGISEAGFRSVIRTLPSPEFWEDEANWRQIQTALPGYRLSKFQPLMSPWIEQEVLLDYLLDRHRAAEWASRVL